MFLGGLNIGNSLGPSIGNLPVPSYLLSSITLPSALIRQTKCSLRIVLFTAGGVGPGGKFPVSLSVMRITINSSVPSKCATTLFPVVAFAKNALLVGDNAKPSPSIGVLMVNDMLPVVGKEPNLDPDPFSRIQKSSLLLPP